MRRTPRRSAGLVAGLLAGLTLAACGAVAGDPEPAPATPQVVDETEEHADDPAEAGGEKEGGHSGHGSATTAAARKAPPLRPGEERLDLEMTEEYTPSAPTGVGTDDYRCFVLDPGLEEDRFLTGTDVLPGNPAVVHHVILFRIAPEDVGTVEDIDAATEGPGWTCFGDAGVRTEASGLDDAPWLGAWAPGGTESVQPRGYGVRLEKGSRIVMQVHYNLLAGSQPDVSATGLRLAAPGADLREIRTMLMPAPVELPCRPGRDDGELCSRPAAVADVRERFGEGPGSLADVLHLLCGSKVDPGPVTTCERTVQQPTTVMAAAGHMHLLGRSLKIEVDPGTPDARTLLDIPTWNFDDQGARPVGPVDLEPGDTLRVTCRHDQALRDELPALADAPERYVVWGEGTTDEMCLGILQVTDS